MQIDNAAVDEKPDIEPHTAFAVHATVTEYVHLMGSRLRHLYERRRGALPVAGWPTTLESRCRHSTNISTR